MITHSLRAALRRFAPRTYLWLRRLTARQRRYSRILRQLGLDPLMPVVQAGPFAGMTFLRWGTTGAVLPRVLGCYEAELHDALEAALAARPRVVVNIGCGEGYYAVGVARRLPECIVYAFDTDGTAREQCAELAAINGVTTRVNIGAVARPQDLAGLPLEGGLVICDCEGCEYPLLDPRAVPALATCDLIVELHDIGDASQPAAMLTRFHPSHDAALVSYAPQSRDPERVAARLPRAEDRALAVVDEARVTGQQWAVLRARARLRAGVAPTERGA